MGTGTGCEKVEFHDKEEYDWCKGIEPNHPWGLQRASEKGTEPEKHQLVESYAEVYV